MNSRMSRWMLFSLVLVLCGMTPTFAQNRGRNASNMSAKERAEARARAEAQDRANDIRQTRETGRTTVTIRPRESGTGNGEGSGSGYGAGGGPPWRRDGGGSDRTDRPSSNGGESSASGATSRPPGRNVTNTARSGSPLTHNQKQAFLNDILVPGGFTKKVLEGNGQVPVSIGDDLSHFANRLSMSTLFLMKTPDQNGHQYITFNYLGHNLSPAQMQAIWSQVLQVPDIVLPVSRVRVLKGRAITVGNEYDLIVGTHAPEIVNPVVVTSVSPYTFTFNTKPGHFLQGSATHGIVKDKLGAVWLYQEGVGVRNEPIQKQMMNYAIADSMWAIMSNIITDQILSPPPYTYGRRPYRMRR